MTVCYISETRVSEHDGKTAMLKARQDIERVFDELGIDCVAFPTAHDGRVTSSAFAKIEEHARSLALWSQVLGAYGKGDTVFVQYPPLNPCIWLYRVLESCAKRGARIVLVVHDLVRIHTMHGDDTASWHKRLYQREEERALKAAWRTSVHTTAMRDEVVRMFGVDADKLITLGVFDYLIDEADVPSGSADKNGPLVVAGNLSPQKAGYLYELPETLPLALLGVSIDESRLSQNQTYHGAFPAEDLPRHLEGSFGIVWDGGSARTCEGTYGDYLRYNSPHKLSLYLACNMPVVIWEEAAQADFVKRHNLGLAVKNLEDLPDRIASLSDDEYRAMREAAACMGRKLRAGWYTCHLIASLG